jgi:hypothetical protein
MIQPKIQEVYTKIDIGDELPKEYDIVSFVSSVPVDNQFPTLTNEKEIEFIFKGWLEDGRFLMHGIGQELAEGKVTHWLKEQQKITFTPEEFEAFKREFGGKLLEKAAENAKLGYDRVLWDDPKEGDDAYMNIPKVDKESIINTLDDYLLNNKI